VKIARLHASNLRCFESLDFDPGPGANWLVGANGAGKTTVLEAAYLLSHGRSFRGGSRAAPCRRGAHEYVIHALLSRADRADIHLGLARGADRWRARLDGNELATLAPLFGACPVICFGAGSEALVLGSPDRRRSFLDWSVFHVEHSLLDSWRAWRRTLRQRNALLRSGAPDGEFAPWEHDLARLAERIHAARARCLASLSPHLATEAAWLVPELGAVHLEYRPGWDAALGLQVQLAAQRHRERERGFTLYGAHRCDWGLRFERVAQREHLSRGQAKAIALVCLLAQTQWLRDQIREYPLLCLDDIESELDRWHVDRLLEWIADKPLQVWLTATEAPPRSQTGPAIEVFHVKHSGISRTMR
jgi:DNA replication and repair protein RecF